MPLVVPGINSSLGDKSEWVNKLMGKKISEGRNDEIVSLCSLFLLLLKAENTRLTELL